MFVCLFVKLVKLVELVVLVKLVKLVSLAKWVKLVKLVSFRHLNVKKGSKPPVFYTFDLKMCFVPQRCALFRHLNVKKGSKPAVFLHIWLENVLRATACTFSLGNVLRATTACTFSTSQLPKVVRTWCGLYILTSKCASRHNGLQFFISHLASWLRTRRFSEPTFRPSWATSHWKNTMNRDFPTFSRTCIFFLFTFSPLWSSHFFSSPLWLFPPLLLQLSILSEVSLLNFLRWRLALPRFHGVELSWDNSLHPRSDPLLELELWPTIGSSPNLQRW